MSKLTFWSLGIASFVALLVPCTSYGQARIVAMSIACSNDHVYTWYSDRKVSVGTSENLAAYQPPHPYSLPFGKTPEDIVGIGIARNDHVYTWYSDSTVSVGTSTDLDKYQPRHPYRLATGRLPGSVVGIDIACSDDHVYVWYFDHKASSGTSDDLDKYRSAYSYSSNFLSPRSVAGIGIAGNDHVYVWYNNRQVSSGTSINFTEYRRPYDYILGPGPCDISADEPKINGRVVSSVGIRGPECKSSGEIVVRLIAINPGNPNKILIARRLTGSNFEVPVTYECTGNRQQTLVTEVASQGRIVKSRESQIANCF